MSTGWVGAMEQPTSDDGTGDAGSRYRLRTSHFLLHSNIMWLNMWTSSESQTLTSEKQSSAVVSVLDRKNTADCNMITVPLAVRPGEAARVLKAACCGGSHVADT